MFFFIAKIKKKSSNSCIKDNIFVSLNTMTYIPYLLPFLLLFVTLYMLYWQERKKKQIAMEIFPDEWERILIDYFSLYTLLPEELKNILKSKIKFFIYQKNFEGCNGFVIKDFHKVLIAASAVLLILKKDNEIYPQLKTILIYPSVYYSKSDFRNSNGSITSAEVAHAGESWSRGELIIVWDIYKKDLSTYGNGENVVIHECAHQLDAESGLMNGIPPIGNRQRLLEWEKSFRDEFSKFRSRNMRSYDVINNYGAVNLSEFFAVCSETFFEQPKLLKQLHPDLYLELVEYYQIDLTDYL